MTHLHPQWLSAWSDLQLPPPAGLFEQLLTAYEQPQRHYHTVQHLQECLALFAQTHTQAQRPGEVAVALWFHDAIYDVRGNHNEAMSAAWAMQALRAAGASNAVLACVHDLIMATQHSALPAPGDAQLLVDIDLAILGAAPDRFAEYQRQIRQEYDWVPEPVYRTKRRAVLQGFVQRPCIYSTAYFQHRYEATARANLAAALSVED